MSNTERKISQVESDRLQSIMDLNDHIQYLEDKMEYYRVQLAEAYYKLATLNNKGKQLWVDGNGY